METCPGHGKETSTPASLCSPFIVSIYLISLHSDCNEATVSVKGKEGFIVGENQVLLLVKRQPRALMEGRFEG